MVPMLAVVAQLLACSPPPSSGEAALRAGPDPSRPAVVLVVAGFAHDLPLAEQTLGVTLPIDHLTTLDQPISAPRVEAPAITRNESARFSGFRRSVARLPLPQASLPPPRSA